MRSGIVAQAFLKASVKLNIPKRDTKIKWEDDEKDKKKKKG
jgi:hypothetical protein